MEDPNSGSILIDGSNINKKPKEALRREIGYVIQDTGLLPHLNIQQNIELVGKISDQNVSVNKIEELLSLIGLTLDVLDKKPSELSGGQQQRIGIARALATDPDIILMDEPFSALDNITRGQLQDDFQQLKHLDKKTIILVTHDVQEAFKLGDKIVLLENGVVQQFGAPFELLNEPANEHVETFLKKDKFILSLQTSKHQDGTLYDLLSNDQIASGDKKKALEQFFNKGS